MIAERISYERGRQQAYSDARAVVLELMPSGEGRGLWVDALLRLDMMSAESRHHELEAMERR